MTPEIFALGIISLEKFHDFKGTFSPDLREYYFCRHALAKIKQTLYVTKIKQGVWTLPIPLAIARGTPTFHPCIAQDGGYLFHGYKGDIWWVDAGIIQRLRPKELK